MYRKENKIRTLALTVLLGMFIAGFVLWVLLQPVVKGSIIFWIGVFLMMVPGYVAMESLGACGLGANFVKRMPKVVRILFGVVWILICMLVFLSIIHFLSSLVGT